jgi:hypothetical protein
MRIVLFVTAFLAFVACNDSDLKIAKTIKTTVFTVEGTSAYQIDEIRFIEKEMFDQRDVKIEHHYLNPDESLKAKEIYDFAPGSRYAKGSTYFDADGTKLSYYKFMYNAKGQRISSHAYDASNNELLRIERYQYNDRDLRNVKEVRDADDVLNRSFLIGYDDEKNENSLTVADATGKVLFREDYKIIGRDKQTNEWVEMWGFIGKTPNSCKVREITR